MSWKSIILLLTLWLQLSFIAVGQEGSWDTLPSLPQTIGLGGPFVGTHEKVLIVAGGANFPDGFPWQGGVKIWHDQIYILEEGADYWNTSFKLDFPLAYGGSVSTDIGVFLIGGSDAEQIYDQVVLLQWDPLANLLRTDVAPSLPSPSAHLAADLLENVIYVMCGQTTTEPTSAENQLWRMDISVPRKDWHWESMDQLPSIPRIKIVSAVQSSGADKKYLYYFSGQQTSTDSMGQYVYRNLTDGYRFDPAPLPGAAAWRILSDCPQPITAGTAMAFGQSDIITYSGSTGRHFHLDIRDRPQFPNKMWSYHTTTDQWVSAGEMPLGVVTTKIVYWDDQFVLPTGEIKPGVRTSIVQTFKPEREKANLGTLNLFVLITSLALLVLIGFYFSKRKIYTS